MIFSRTSGFLPWFFSARIAFSRSSTSAGTAEMSRASGLARGDVHREHASRASNKVGFVAGALERDEHADLAETVGARGYERNRRRRPP